jgi:tetratricopeptide (TPR) repeat protein
MPRPRRRRRFFALEGRFEVDPAGEFQVVIDEGHPDAAPPADEAAVDAGASLALPGPLEEPGEVEPAADETVPAAFRLQRPPRTRPQPKARASFFPLWLVLGGLALGALAGYCLAGWVRKPGPAESGSHVRQNAAAEPGDNVQQYAAVLTHADEDDLDAAYAANHARRYAEAEQLFASLKRRHPGWGLMDIELGRTQLYENRRYDASYTLKTAAERGEMPAEANFLLGMLNMAQGSNDAAESNFALAVSLDPTKPDYYFFWGECLRSEGKLLGASAKFRSALLRNQNEAAIGLYRAKLWLSEIEADRENADGTRAEIDAALAQPHPAMDALVAAAARDLKAGDIDAAASHLLRARRGAEPEVFAFIMNDSYFALVRTRPELAELFRSASPGPTPAEAGRAASSPAPTKVPPAGSPVGGK